VTPTVHCRHKTFVTSTVNESFLWSETKLMTKVHIQELIYMILVKSQR